MAQPVTLVRVFPDLDSLSARVAREFIAVAEETLQSQSHFSVVLAGGRTPLGLYRILARERVPWDRIVLFWGDERYVPPQDSASNSGGFNDLVLKTVNVPAANVHPMPTDRQDPEEAAREYERYLRAWAGGEMPRFDLVLLGVGFDGHTASLFPGSREIADRWVIATRAPEPPRQRLSLNYPVLNAARNVWFLVTGGEKADVVRRALGAIDEPPADLPASRVRPARGSLVWWLDAAAATEIDALGEGAVRVERDAGW